MFAVYLVIVQFFLGISVNVLHSEAQERVISRLPNVAIPTKYDLEVTPDFNNDIFQGNVSVYFKILKDTKSVTFHQKNLFFSVANGTIFCDKSKYGAQVKVESDTLVLTFNGTVVKENQCILKMINFTGILNTEQKGLYKGYIKDQTGKLRPFAATQFWPTYAREVFPCFDEPNYKAVLNLKINRPSNTYMTVSNAMKNESASKGLVDVFESTLPMSTYLYAFVVSELKFSDQYQKVRIIARSQDLLNSKHEYAMTKSRNILGEMEKYLKIKYLMKKLDHVALPAEYIPVNSMENWGMITYADPLLLVSEETDANNEQEVIITIAHEISHQWFGNLVTPIWWKYAWLSEGFATFFSSFAADWVEPNMDLMQQFVVKVTHNALYLDSLENNRAMNTNPETNEQIPLLFDGITYAKGASVIRMLREFVTDYVFENALRLFLFTKKFDNVQPSDFYNIIQLVLDSIQFPIWNLKLNVTDIMTSWDSNVGYPVVNVTRAYGLRENNIILHQERFTLNDSVVQNGSWKIPINFYSGYYTNNTLPSMWLTKTDENTSFPYANDNDWLIVNVKQTGFYRVNYDEKNWGLIKDGLIKEHKSFHVLNRAQIIDDAFNLARSGRLNYDIPLQLSLYLKQEQDYIAFYPFFQSITFLNHMLQYTNVYSSFKNHVLNVLEDIYQYLSFDDVFMEDHTETLNRMEVLQWICRCGHEECRSLSSEVFGKWKNDNRKRVPVNLQSAVFCSAMRTGTKEDHDFLRGKLSDDAHLRLRIINGLGCSENSEIVKNYLESSISTTNSLTPDVVILSVYDKSPVGLQSVLDFLEANFTSIKNRSASSMELVVQQIGSIIAMENQHQQLKKISDKSGTPDIFAYALNASVNNINWLQKTNSSITAALGGVGGGGTNSKTKMYANNIITVFCLLTVITFKYKAIG